MARETRERRTSGTGEHMPQGVMAVMRRMVSPVLRFIAPLVRSALLTLLLGVVLASALCWAIFTHVLPTMEDSWVSVLLTQRGAFQHINTGLFLFGLFLLLFAAIRCAYEKDGKWHLEPLMRIVHGRWRELQEMKDGTGTSVRDGSSAVEGEWRTERTPGQGQGIALLGGMVDSRCIELSAPGDYSTARVRSGHGYLVTQRVCGLGRCLFNTRAQNIIELLDMNRDLSSLDDEELSGQFTLVRYAVYLMPVIGFLGTVWGIGQALGGISTALPDIRNLDDFIDKLGVATYALRVAFDTTLLALGLSGLLTAVLTLVTAYSGSVLSEIDRWIIDNMFGHLAERSPVERQVGYVAGQLYGIREQMEKLGDSSELAAASVDGIQDNVKSLIENVESLANESQVAQRILQRIEQHGGRSADELQALQGALDNSQKEVAGHLQSMVSVLENVEAAAAAIHQEQANGMKDVRTLTGAVLSLPSLVRTLEGASNKLADLADRLTEVGDMAGAVQSGTELLSGVKADTETMRSALEGADLREAASQVLQKADQVATALSALQAALTNELKQSSQETVDRLSVALSGLDGTLKIMRGTIQGLTEAFEGLANEIREGLMRGRGS